MKEAPTSFAEGRQRSGRRDANDTVSDLAQRVARACQRIGALDRCCEVASVASALEALAHERLLELPALSGNSRFGRADMRCVAPTIEALAAQSGALASIYMVNIAIGAALVSIEGTERQRSEILPELRAGRLELAFALTEPNAGSDAASLETRAMPTPTGYVLTGEKIYTTGAASARWIIVVATVPHIGPEKRAFGMFMVPRDAKGVSLTILNSMRGDAHPSCRLVLDDVSVGFDDILGGKERLGCAWEALRKAGTVERVAVAAMATGLAGAAAGRATTFATERRQFGKPIAAFQAIQHMLVDMRLAHRAMRLFVDEAVDAFEGASAAEEAAMAKCFCAEQLQEVVAKGMRVMGGRAYFDFEPMARFYREAPFSLYAGGTGEVQRLLIARAMGLP